MKLKVVQRTSARGLQSTSPKLTISKKGTIYFNSLAMQRLGADKAVKIKFLVEEDNAQAWYISVCKDGYATLKPKTSNDKSGQVNVTDISRLIIDSFYHIGKGSLKFTLGESFSYNDQKVFQLTVDKQSIEMNIPNPNGRL